MGAVRGVFALAGPRSRTMTPNFLLKLLIFPILAGFALFLAPAAACLDVGGPLTVNTTWARADSPINVVASVRVRSGATLTIEAGVVVNVSSQQQVIVEQGAIRAIGSESALILFDAPTATPGAWGPIEFQDGTDDSLTVFDRVVVRHGKGMSIRRSSPTLNRVSLENNAGPAISVDLESSPSGVGLSAQGNDLNGILVPPGVITGSVRWGLVGIPYVVQQGVVTIGLPPLTLTPTSVVLREFEQAMFTVRLAKPAPPGGMSVDVVSSVPNVGSVPGTLTIPAGVVQASFAFDALAAGSTTISVSRLELGAVSATVTVRPRVVISLVPDTLAIPVGQSRILGVHLNEAAPIGGVDIQLSSSNTAAASVPAQVTVPPLSSSATFSVSASAVGSATVTATAPNHVSGSAEVEARRAFLSFGPIGVLAPGSSRSVDIELSESAPVGGLQIQLSSGTPGIVSHPPGVLVGAGESSANFVLAGASVGTTNLSAAATDYDAALATVTVVAISLSFDPGGPVAIPIGATEHFTIRSSRPAPPGGISVSLSAPPEVSVMPTQLDIMEGTTASSAPVAITAINNSEGLTVTAQSPDAQGASLNVTISPPRVLQFNQVSTVLGKGLRTELFLTRFLGDGGGDTDADPLIVTLLSGDPVKLSVPSTVTIPGGQESASVPFSAFSASDSIIVTASASGYPDSASIEVVIAEPEVRFLSLDGNRGVGSVRDDFQLELSVPGGSTGVAIASIPVDLSIVDSNPPDVVSGIFSAVTGATPLTQLVIRTGRSSSTNSDGSPASAYVGSPGESGTYQVAAQIAGQASYSSDVQSVLEGPKEIVFSQINEVVGRGFILDALQVFRLQQGEPYAGETALLINLTVSDSGKIGVPLSVEIPAGAAEVSIPIEGLALTTNPVTIAASAPGYTPPADVLSLDVVEAQTDFGENGPPGQSFFTNQEVSGPRNLFNLNWRVPGSEFPQGSAVDRPIALELIDQDPPGIVSGFFPDWQGTDPLGTLVLMAGTAGFGENSFFYIGSPQSAGTYRLSATATGLQTAVTQGVTVTDSPEGLSFYGDSPPEQAVIGRGLRSYIPLERSGTGLLQPLTVNLASSHPENVTVPAAMTFALGERRILIPFSGVSSSAGSITVSARVPGQPALSDDLHLIVVDPTIRFGELQGTRGVDGARDEFYVYWDVPGSYDVPVSETNTTISLSIVSPSSPELALGLFAAGTGGVERLTLEIPAGQNTSATATGDLVALFIETPGVTGSYRVHAESVGFGGAVSDIQIVVIPSLWFNSATEFVLGKGLSSTAVEIVRVAGNVGEAPANDLTVSVVCTSAFVCTAPGTVTLPARQVSVAMQISGTGIGAARVIASADGLQSSDRSEREIRVVKPNLRLFDVPGFMQVGETEPVLVKFEVPTSTDVFQVAAAPIAIDFTSAVPSVVTVSPSIVIPAGENESNLAILQGLASGFTTITASSIGAHAVTSETVTVSE